MGSPGNEEEEESEGRRAEGGRGERGPATDRAQAQARTEQTAAPPRLARAGPRRPTMPRAGACAPSYTGGVIAVTSLENWLRARAGPRLSPPDRGRHFSRRWAPQAGNLACLGFPIRQTGVTEALARGLPPPSSTLQPIPPSTEQPALPGPPPSVRGSRPTPGAPLWGAGQHRGIGGGG